MQREGFEWLKRSPILQLGQLLYRLPLHNRGRVAQRLNQRGHRLPTAECSEHPYRPLPRQDLPRRETTCEQRDHLITVERLQDPDQLCKIGIRVSHPANQRRSELRVTDFAQGPGSLITDHVLRIVQRFEQRTRGPRVLQLAQRIRRIQSHILISIAQGLDQRIHRVGRSDKSQGLCRLLPHLSIVVLQRSHEILGGRPIGQASQSDCGLATNRNLG